MFRTNNERTRTGANNASASSTSRAAAQPQPAAAASPAALEAARTVGRSNPALVDLQHMRRGLSPLQDGIVDSVAQFYADSAAPKSNRELGFSGSAEAVSNMTGDHARTLERRASFLLNSEAMDALHPLLANVARDAGILGHSVTTMAVNAVATSVKSQTELVKAVALKQAQDGERVCPMTLQPAHFQRMLDENASRLAQVVEACRLPVAARERTLKPLLEQLAMCYFQHAETSSGAGDSGPHNVVVTMSDQGQSHAEVSAEGTKTARLAIDSAGIDRLCNAPLPAADACEDYETIFRAHLLQGFQNHSPDQKRAALYLQLLWSEVGTVQETLGMRSRDRPHHGAAAQRAAARAHEEMYYPGNEDFGDQIGSENDMHTQRRAVTHGMEILPDVDFSFKERFGASMLTDPRIRDWTQSTAYPFDLRMLRQPSSRLLLQSIPITGTALLQTPAFRSPGSSA